MPKYLDRVQIKLQSIQEQILLKNLSITSKLTQQPLMTHQEILMEVLVVQINTNLQLWTQPIPHYQFLVLRMVQQM